MNLIPGSEGELGNAINNNDGGRLAPKLKTTLQEKVSKPTVYCIYMIISQCYSIL
jgi:hypothetical protein